MEVPDTNNLKKSCPSWGEIARKRAPNVLTLLRLVAVPIFVILLINPSANSRIWACAIFIIASLTDWLDGYLARIFKAESVLGTMLDPIADKILVTAALVMLVATPATPKIPAWLVVVLLSRDILVGGLRSIAAVQGTVVPASMLGKLKTTFTMIAIPFLLVREVYQVLGNPVDFHRWGMGFLWLALFFSLASGFHYGLSLKRFWHEEPNELP